MNPNIAVSGIYMEMSRGFLNQDIHFQPKDNLQNYNDIPELVLLNIRFSQFAAAVIFSISALEAYVNLIIHDILYERFQIEKFKDQPNYQNIYENIIEFKSRYSDKTKEENLFKKEILTKKINKLYKCFDLKLLSESPLKGDQELWGNLEKLQDIRNGLIHPKPYFIESEEFKEFFNQSEDDFKESLLTPIIIREKLFKDTPVFQTNEKNNVLLSNYTYHYKGDAIQEHIFLTSSAYTLENVTYWKTRWIS